jgi:GTPase SAR1 family protein
MANKTTNTSTSSTSGVENVKLMCVGDGAVGKVILFFLSLIFF